MRPLVVALHGHGGSPATIGPHARRLAPADDVVAPAGPLRAGSGHAWFDPDGGDLTAGLAVLDDAAAPAAAVGRPVVLVGSSQGAALALAAALRPPPRVPLRAVVAIAGFLPDPDGLALDPTPADDRPQVLLWAAEDDEVVPPLRVRAAAKVLTRHGLSVELASGPGGHEISDAALAAGATWLDELQV